MTAQTLRELEAKATEEKWFLRYCDDDNHQCMTVISNKDHGQTNTGQFKDEPDTVAITFHQLMPSVGDNGDCNEARTRLIIYLRNHAQDFIRLMDAAGKMQRINGSCQRALEQSGMNEALAAFKEQP